MSTTKRIKRGLLNVVQFVAMLAMSLIAADALAQTNISLGDLQAAAEGPPEDAAMRLFGGLLGESFGSTNPWSASGMPTTLIGDLFLTFNAIVFVVGTVWLAYVCIMVIATSAQDGEVLGKNTSPLFAPIRIGVGIFGMMPVIGGFSVFQAIMMSSIALGIGAANIMTGKVISSTHDFKAITPSFTTAGAAPNLSSDIQAAVRGMVLAEMCIQGKNLASSALPLEYEPLRPALRSDKNRIQYDYGKCGRVEVARRQGEDVRRGEGVQSTLGFRLNAINYQGIADAVHAAARAELSTIQREASAIVADWMRDYAFSTYLDQDDPRRAAVDMVAASNIAYQRSVALEKAARARLNGSVAQAAENDAGAIEESALQTMSDGGWMRLGNFYSVYAEASAAMADAQRAFQIRFVHGADVEKIMAGEISNQPWQRGMREFLQIASVSETTSDKGWLDKIVDTVAPENEMGHRSTGQAIVNAMIGWVAEDSGGAGLVNPITAAKNLGDWLMIAGQSGVAAGTLSDVIPAGKGVKVAKWFAPSLEKLGEIATIVCYSFIGIGMFLAIFIPMSIWATWISAILIYLTSMLEGLIYAQLAAFSHIKAEGDRFVDPGSSAAKFYIYLANALFRPAAMVLGFILASALMTFMGTFVVEGFSEAMASAQGNSMTGMLSIVGYLILFCVVLFGLVQACASLVIDIPDRLLGWIGGVADNNRGAAVIGAAAGTAMRGMKGPGGGSAAGARTAASTVTPRSK